MRYRPFRVVSICLSAFLAILAQATAAELRAVVDVSEQRMYLLQDQEIINIWPVSTARSGFRTPLGRFRPTRLERTWFSTKYDNAPMPYSVFFRGGYAIHGTVEVRKLGRPVSHGCVRLETINAKSFFRMVQHHGLRNTWINIRE
jgi:lipoprotein-anchoring transpeptidase ErfK/SrfK